MDEDLPDDAHPSRGAAKSLSLAHSEIIITRMTGGVFDTPEHLVIVAEDAFNAIIQLADTARCEVRQDGRLLPQGNHPRGALAIAGLREQWQWTFLTPFDVVRLHIPRSHVRAFAAQVGRPEFSGFDCPFGTSDDVILGLAQALLPALEAPEQASRLFVEQISLAMLTHLTQAYGGLHFPEGRKGVLALWQEKRATEFLAAHVNTAFSIEELAAACGLSRSYFIKAFRETFGRTPYRWLMEFRVARAKELLRSNGAIAEIAVACGFADQSHMTRVFSDIVGEAPGTWRRNNRP